MDSEVTEWILAASFGLWSGVVAWAARQVTIRIDRIAETVKNLDTDLHQWVYDTEHRLTTLEEWRNGVDRTLK